ncbi:hypothetical protein DYBT9623_02637 [Dyadobacter sp. CECT 9623]|uniref:Uncharacterized protein n=1 Tax=Dyadobacter linearis TaxID=2823330 RepID=A0ABN7R755_9BACT|nr:hypothetical protein [Dyadobacter sp. CECT 9623]CAG5069900.1 hypothetical protein DYBT9623_02637 [Dyadobacter sp. CECT 9623]
MKKAVCFILIAAAVVCQQNLSAQTREKMLRDSTMKYGVEIEPYLKKASGGKIVKDFNYSPYINKFLKENKYVKFPPYPISIGTDDSFEGYKRHISVSSGNRLYFPKGSSLVCPTTLKTNGYMCFIAWDVKNVFIDGINLVGSKANPDYKTSEYGAGIAMYAPVNVLVSNATVTKSSGDGVTVRVQWKKQSRDITINKLTVTDATRVGMLVTGIINGTFRDITIDGTGEEDKAKVVKPQTGLSFEPNDCTSRYVNCKFYNLQTKNNLGPVLATTNFYNIFTKNTCGVNKIDILINKWTDYTDHPMAYGASFAIGSGDMTPYDTKDISGTFKIINPTIIKNTEKPNYYFFQGTNESRKGGVKYTLTNLKLVHQGKEFTLKNRASNEKIKNMINQANASNKVLIN